MNFQRGFLRIWIVCSTIWALRCLVAIILQLVNAEVPKFYIGDTEEGFYSALKKDFTSSEFQNLSMLEPSFESPLKTGDVVFIATRRGNHELDQIRTDAIAHANRLRSGKFWERVYEAFHAFVRGGLLPPFVLLAFGASVGWALSGFRRV